MSEHPPIYPRDPSRRPDSDVEPGERARQCRPRDPDTFAGGWRRARRADHILWRTAFVQSKLAALRMETLTLHRGVGSDAAIEPGHAVVLESWSFHRGVAEGVAGSPGESAHRAVDTREFPHRRAFMTYLETRAMNRQFLEAEAVLFVEGSGVVG